MHQLLLAVGAKINWFRHQTIHVDAVYIPGISILTTAALLAKFQVLIAFGARSLMNLLDASPIIRG